jgi:hypothetical protein
MDSTSPEWHAEQSESGLQDKLLVVSDVDVVVVVISEVLVVEDVVEVVVLDIVVVQVDVEIDVDVLEEVAVVTEVVDDDVVFGLQLIKTRFSDKNSIANSEQHNKNLLLIILPKYPLLPQL